ncbi:MAG: restriction endonuclease subunit S [Thermodesulfovibrionales bacterium]|nr:restriction endonuclease subunit S [Thermodesulfovibrionales bacterium]
MVKLGEVLTERKEVPSQESILSGAVRIIEKIGFNDGKIQLRTDGKTKTGMILIHPGDLVVSGINAAKGAIAIYEDDNEEPIAATIHYGAYIPNKERIDINFLWWLLRSHTFKELLLEYVPGGIKTELKAKRFLPIPVPLPTLPEQQRVVARIEELAEKVEEAKGLRGKAVEEAGAVSHAFLKSLIESEKAQVWAMKYIPEVADINPSRQIAATISDNTQVSFVPMSAVDDITGKITRPEIRHLCEVRKGYTFFAEGDVIFARITPCMQNGKSAIAKGLKNGIGFGSTEFHVIRPKTDLLANWLHVIVRHKDFKDAAGAHFKGTAGQQRVPQRFLENKKIPVPPLPEQRRIVEYLDSLQSKVDELKKLQSETQKELNALMPSILDKVFKGELQ